MGRPGKPGNRNFGGVAIAARKRASGVWEEEKAVGESPAVTDAFVAPDHTRERKKDEEGRGGGAALALLLTCVVIIRSVPGSRRPSGRVAVVAAPEYSTAN